MPIHREIHWCLAVINKKEKKFQYLDSVKGMDSRVLKTLVCFLFFLSLSLQLIAFICMLTKLSAIDIWITLLLQIMRLRIRNTLNSRIDSISTLRFKLDAVCLKVEHSLILSSLLITLALDRVRLLYIHILIQYGEVVIILILVRRRDIL